MKLAAVTAAITLVAAGCAESERGDGSSGEGQDTFIFGAAGAPDVFDPFYATDGETFRPARQIFETLITHEPGTANLAPGLAESWESNEDGTQWTFHLRDGVTFHDGTEFNAEAVCFNFDRWYNQPTAAGQAQAVYYADVFGGFAQNQGDYGESNYVSCEATDELTAVITLREFNGSFPAAFSLTSLSISSPTALQQYDADNVRQEGEAFIYPEYATSHPVGTGPYRFVEYDEAEGVIRLEAYEDYWGEPARTRNLIFQIIPDEAQRRQALDAGQIHGYDFPSPADYASLEEAGYNLMVREPFNILYLGINQAGNPALTDLRVRQAIAHAINREELVRTRLPEGAEVATQFIPDTVVGYADDVQTYEYDPDRARQLLAEAGYPNLTLRFHVPTEVTRPYMPNPQEIFETIAADLQEVGITIEQVSLPWNGGYIDAIRQTPDHDLHLLGWTGDFNDPVNFVGTFFGRPSNEFGINDANSAEMFAAIAAANSIVDAEEKEAAWQQVNRDLLSQWLPAIPISHSPPAIVVASNVSGLVPSPLTQEEFSTVVVE